MAHLENPRREKLYIQEVLVWIPDNRFDYAITTETLSNGSGNPTDEISDILGSFVGDDGELIVAGDESDITGVVVGLTDGALQELTLADGADTDHSYFVLRRGPALVNIEHLKVEDAWGGEYDMEAVLEALTALNMLTKNPPDFTTVHNT